MPGPRIRIGVYLGRPHRAYHGTFDRLARAGHAVVEYTDPAETEGFAAVIIVAGDHHLADAVNDLALHVHRGQIVLHTALAHDATALDALEIEGAVVGALHPFGISEWVVDYVDEAGEAVVQLLVAELGGNPVRLPLAARADLAPALTWATATGVVRGEARALLDEALGANADRVTEKLFTDPAPDDSLPLPDELDDQLARQLADGGGRPRARAFVDLVRRAAELRGDHDVELWALLHPGNAGDIGDTEDTDDKND